MGRIEDAMRKAGATDRSDSSTPFDEEAWVVSDSPDTSYRPVNAPSDGVSGTFAESDGAPIGNPKAYRADLLAVLDGAHPVLTGQFRRIAATLYNAQDGANLKLVMVASAAPGEGKTLTAINIAMILSESFRCRVLLVDADMRKPSLHEAWEMAGERGLSDALQPGNEEKLHVIKISERLTLLPAGRSAGDPTGGLTSDRMHRILDTARTEFDWVIVDSPPVAAVDDAALLASMVDAVLLVVRAGQTRSDVIQRAIEQIGRDRIFGVALNAVEPAESYQYRSYNYGYSTQPTEHTFEEVI